MDLCQYKIEQFFWQSTQLLAALLFYIISFRSENVRMLITDNFFFLINLFLSFNLKKCMLYEMYVYRDGIP